MVINLIEKNMRDNEVGLGIDLFNHIIRIRMFFIF